MRALCCHRAWSVLSGDLAVGRTPKDIDVLTSASLDQVQCLFHRKSSQTGLTTGDGKSTIIPLIIGKRHPIVQVWRQTKGQGDSTDGTGKVREHLMDVSSFYTDAGVDEVPGFDDESVTTTPEQGYPCPPASNDAGWAKARAANAKRRDFTANALLYDPFKNELFEGLHSGHRPEPLLGGSRFDFKPPIFEKWRFEPPSMLPESCPKVVRKLTEIPKVDRKLSESCPKVDRKLSESCPKVCGKLPGSLPKVV